MKMFGRSILSALCAVGLSDLAMPTAIDPIKPARVFGPRVGSGKKKRNPGKSSPQKSPQMGKYSMNDLRSFTARGIRVKNKRQAEQINQMHSAWRIKKGLQNVAG